WSKNRNWILDRAAQRSCLFQIGDTKNVRLIGDGPSHLDHPMAVGIRFDDCEKLHPRPKLLTYKRDVTTQCAPIDLSPTAVMLFHRICAGCGVVTWGSRR